MHPVGQHRILALAALSSLLLAPLAHAEAPPATLQAESASWSDARLAGAVVGIRIRHDLSGPLDAWFKLQAKTIDVEVDASSLYVHVQPASLPPPAAAFQSTDRATFTNATLLGASAREGAFLYLFARGPVEVAARCFLAQAARDALLTASSKVNTSRAPITADSSRSLELLPCPGSQLSVRGTFLLVLWERDALWSSDEGNGTLRSGKAQSALPGLDTRPFVSRAQQAYLHVNDGSFQVLADAATTALFMETVRLQTRNLSLLQASGQIRHEEAQGRRIELVGDLDVGLARHGKAVAAQVGGELQGGDIDGEALPLLLSDLAQPVHQPLVPWLVVGLVPVASVPVVLAPLLRRRRSSKLRILQAIGRVYDLFSLRRYEQADRLASKLLDLAPDNAELHYLHAACLGHLGRHRDALAHHEAAHRLLREKGELEAPLAAENAYEAARSAAQVCDAAGLHERERWHNVVVEWLWQAVSRDPAVEEDLALHAELQPFLLDLRVWKASRADDSPEWMQP